MVPDQPPPLALYVHWPFCVSKCPYCDFNSHVRDSVDQAAWRQALLADLAHEAAALPGRRLASIFFGGGTPSLMPPATVAAIIEAADAGYTVFQTAPEEEEVAADNPLIIAETRVDVPEATVSDAVMMLDLRNTQALLFKNTGTGTFNMVYRRNDGTIGWVEPQRAA